MPNWWPFRRRKRKNKKLQEKASAGDEAITSEKQTLTATTEQSAPQTPPRQVLSEKSVVSPPQSSPPVATPGTRASAEEITALPASTIRERSPHLRHNNTEPANRPPSLHSKRSATNDPSDWRRKLSRRSKSDPRQDPQFRSMSSPIPVPKIPGSEKRMRDDINNSSALSLPHAASIRSSVTGFSDNQYEVGTVDVFSPRPTIRYSLQSQAVSGAIRSAVASRTESRWEGEGSPRQVLKESKTIDDLADRYDATTLRELMERDRKRRERKRVTDEDRARRRLERHAARERGEAGPSTKSKRRGRSPRTEMAEHRRRERASGLGVSGVDAGPSSPKSPKNAQDSKGKDPEQGRPVKETEDLSRANEPGSEVVTPVDEPVIATAEEVRYSQASMSPPTSPTGHARKPSYIDQLTDPRSRSATNLSESSADAARRTSESSAKRAGPIAALLRRSAPPGRGSAERSRKDVIESSFSNTSRESMRAQAAPAHLREVPSAQSGRSGTPTRTMSKFREDLPESVTDPSESRGGSLTEPPVPPISALQREKLGGLTVDTGQRNDSMGSTTAPSAAVLSQSLASVDSEGSWLSGKPAKRGSQQMTPQMLAERSNFQGSYENLGVADDEYFRRQNTSNKPRSGLSGIGAALGSKDGEKSKNNESNDKPVEKEERIAEGDVSRRPTFVRQESRKKSSEGLLSQFTEGEAEGQSTSGAAEEDKSPVEASPIEDESPPIKPVLGHARSVSRGSAKLVDMSSRRSSAQPPPKVQEDAPKETSKETSTEESKEEAKEEAK